MIQIVIQLLIVLFIVIIYFEIKKWFIKRKLRDFESPHQIPILGGAGRFFGKRNDELIDLILDIYNEVKSTPFQAWFGPVLVVGVSEPQDVKIILTSDQCLDKPYFYDFLHCKTSIIVAEKSKWKRDRRALNCAFNHKMLQNYMDPLNAKSRILLEKVEPHIQEPGNLYRTIFICMMDMITKTTMGSEINLQTTERGSHFYKIAKFIMNNIQYRIARIWLRWDFVYHYLSKVGRDESRPLDEGNGLFDEIYDKKLTELALLKSQGIEYLQEIKEQNTMNILEKCLVLEQEGVFTHENVLDEMRVIVLAGIDTSSITVFGTLLMLVINQKHQDLVVDELRTVFESADCDVTQTHLTAMKYTERVIKESMRLIPPVPFILRKPSADIELPNGAVRNPNVWGENVLEFDPDRFLPENVAKHPPFSYVPFSGGPRNCTDLRFDEIRLNTHLVTEVVNENPLRVENREFLV